MRLSPLVLTSYTDWLNGKRVSTFRHMKPKAKRSIRNTISWWFLLLSQHFSVRTPFFWEKLTFLFNGLRIKRSLLVIYFRKINKTLMFDLFFVCVCLFKFLFIVFQEFLDKRQMTEWGNIELLDDAEEDGTSKSISLPGVLRGDMSSRHWKAEVRVCCIRFSPTGKANRFPLLLFFYWFLCIIMA